MLFSGKKAQTKVDTTGSHFIMVKQLQKKPQQGLRYRRTLAVADSPDQLMAPSPPHHGGFMNLFQIKSEDEIAESKKEQLKQHLEMLLCANLDPQLRRDTIADLTRRIATLESTVDSLNLQLDKNIKEQNQRILD